MYIRFISGFTESIIFRLKIGMLRVVPKWNLISRRCLSCTIATNRATNRKKPETAKKSSGRKRNTGRIDDKISEDEEDRIAQQAFDDILAEFRSQDDIKRSFFSKTKYIVTLKSSESLLGSTNPSEIYEDKVWISETLPSTSKLRLHMIGEAFFEVENLQKKIEDEELNMKAGFFKKCLVFSAALAVLPVIAMRFSAEGLRS